ncbi:hypothetical protein PoB_004106000 [Plakobranchus ocellatus]|uniref:Uncharacterized protein n=1 Tax=Plakobranchus ocellatus TaxID=259542 RepID=A0AAV4B4M8_9GAST|nr:hypothetical protein PoB_004106000 [Plakobranchus ocellatus]
MTPVWQQVRVYVGQEGDKGETIGVLWRISTAARNQRYQDIIPVGPETAPPTATGRRKENIPDRRSLMTSRGWTWAKL